MNLYYTDTIHQYRYHVLSRNKKFASGDCCYHLFLHQMRLKSNKNNDVLTNTKNDVENIENDRFPPDPQKIINLFKISLLHTPNNTQVQVKLTSLLRKRYLACCSHLADALNSMSLFDFSFLRSLQ